LNSLKAKAWFKPTNVNLFYLSKIGILSW